VLTPVLLSIRKQTNPAVDTPQ